MNFVACSIGMSPGFAPFQDFVDEGRGAAEHRNEVDAVAEKPAIPGEGAAGPLTAGRDALQRPQSPPARARR